MDVRTKIIKPNLLHELLHGVDSTICKAKKTSYHAKMSVNSYKIRKIVSAERYIEVSQTEHSTHLHMKPTSYMRKVIIKLANCNQNFATWPFSHQKNCVNIMVLLKCRIMNFDVKIYILLTSNILK